jgi:hypothetical protein
MSYKNTNYFQIILVTILFFIGINFSFTQPTLPQRSITVASTQSLQFGTFALTGGAGGTVNVGWDGSRTATGNIALLAMAPMAQPAIFEIKLCQGRNVSITYAPTTTLTGDNGGSIILDIGPTEKGSNGAFFPTNNNCNFITILRVGGKLHIPIAAIPGNYTGNFYITFNQE